MPRWLSVFDQSLQTPRTEPPMFEPQPIIPRAAKPETRATGVKRYLDISDISGQVAEETAEVAFSLDLDARLSAFKRSISNNTKNHTELKTKFQKYCPDGEDATKFSTLVFEHLLQTRSYFPRLVRFLTDPALSLPGTGNACKMIRHLNTVEVGEGSVSKAATRHRALLFRLRTMSERCLLTEAETLDVISELSKTPRLVCSDIGHSHTYRALWEVTSNTVSSYDASSDCAFLERVTKAFGIAYKPVKFEALEKSSNPIAEHVLGLSMCYLKRERKKDESFIAVFNSLPRDRLHVWFRAVIVYLTNQPQTEEVKNTLSAWLEFLRVFPNTSLNPIEWQMIYAMLARKDISPASIAVHLETLQPEVLTEALLNHWIPRYLPDPKTNPWGGVVTPRFSHFRRAHISRMAGFRNKSLERMLLDVIVGMNEKKIPTLATTTHILELVNRFQAKVGAVETERFLGILKERGVDQIDPKVLYEIVLEKMDTQPEYALRLCSYISNSRTCYDPHFPIQMLLQGIKSRMRMHKILETAARNDHLPAVFRTSPLKDVLNVRAELAHQIAYQFSLDESITSRASARSVYYFYRYLRSHHLPIGPLMTKALVRVVVTRPLSERRFASTRRYVWLRSLVSQVEGEEVAQQLDKLFWEWRGKVIADAKRRFVETGGYGPAHVNTVKKLGL